MVLLCDVNYQVYYRFCLNNDLFSYENIGQTDDGKIKYGFIGYMTVYKFYAYPKNLRPRVSQVLILPPFRNNGHATQLLQTFYRDFVPMSNVIDIAGEIIICIKKQHRN